MTCTSHNPENTEENKFRIELNLRFHTASGTPKTYQVKFISQDELTPNEIVGLVMEFIGEKPNLEVHQVDVSSQLAFQSGNDYGQPGEVLAEAHKRLHLLNPFILGINDFLSSTIEEYKLSQLTSAYPLKGYIKQVFQTLFSECYTSKIPSQFKDEYNLFIQNCSPTFTSDLYNLLEENTNLVPNIFSVFITKITKFKKDIISHADYHAAKILLSIPIENLIFVINNLAIGYNGSIGAGENNISGYISVINDPVSNVPIFAINPTERQDTITIIGQKNLSNKIGNGFLNELAVFLKARGVEIELLRDRAIFYHGKTGMCPLIFGQDYNTSTVYLNQIQFALRCIQNWVEFYEKSDHEP